MKRHAFSALLIQLSITSCLLLLPRVTVASDFGQPLYLAPRRVYLYKTGFYADVAAKWVSLMQVDLNVVAGDGGFSDEGRPLDNSAWGPMIEGGYRASNFFDFFSAFFWYRLTDSGWTYGETDADNLAYRLDLADYQIRIGTRSWVPLHGIGKFGVNVGGLISAIPFSLDVSRYSGGIIQGGSHADTWTVFGGFAGIDAEVVYGKVFAKGQIEGSLATGNRYGQLLGLAANVNTSGLSFSIGGGMRF